MIVTDLSKRKDEKLNDEQLEKLETLCKYRLSSMPEQYSTGESNFRDMKLKMKPPIFIPEQETEFLVELSLKRMNDFGNRHCTVLEIGCGSGAISLSILRSKKNARVVALDANPHACELTKQNALSLNLEGKLILLNAKMEDSGHITVMKNYTQSQPLKMDCLTFDFIVSNPPYEPTKTIFNFQPEVRMYEDIKAFDGGDDGLRIIKPILQYASTALNDDGFLILEVYSNHGEKIRALVEKNYSDKLKFESVIKNADGNDKYVEIKKIRR